MQEPMQIHSYDHKVTLGNLIKSHTHPVDLEPTTSPSTKHLQGEEVKLELELIGNKEIFYSLQQLAFTIFMPQGWSRKHLLASRFY